MSNMNETTAMQKAGLIYREIQSEINALRREANRVDLGLEEKEASAFMLAVAHRLERLQRDLGFLVLDMVSESVDAMKAQ